MKNKFLIIGLAMGSLAFSQKSQCIAFTTKGLQCKIMVFDSISNTCHHHVNKIGKMNGDTTYLRDMTNICGSLTTKNLSCKNKTKHESGKCYHHRPKN
tara:strand:- start:299 stop:592 length:294 start_codon:yes stop_codon:yes gene_type:complete